MKKLLNLLLVIIGLITIMRCGNYLPSDKVKVVNSPNNDICTDTFRVEKLVYDTIKEKIIEILPDFVITAKSPKPGIEILDTLPRNEIVFDTAFIGGNIIFISYRIRKDTIQIIQEYYCNQILINYEDGVTEDQVKKTRDTLTNLGFNIVKSCPCSTIEIWGPDAGKVIDPEELNKARRNSLTPKSGGGPFASSSLNFLIPIPSSPDTFPQNGFSIPPKNNAKNSVKVALIDSGILNNNFSNKSLEDYWWSNPKEKNTFYNWLRKLIGLDCYGNDLYGYDFYHDEPIARGMKNSIDVNGHGTHVGGIIVGANIAKQASVNLELMDLKIFHESSGDLFSLVCATNYSIDNGASIINQSLGFYSNFPPQILVDIIKKAADNNILIITSAGNSGLDNDNIVDVDSNFIIHHYPSDIESPNIISVAALSIERDRLWLESISDKNVGSNYGAKFVDVAAPGERIPSAYIGGHAHLSGTSMAAGQITRVAAIIKYNWNLDALDIKKCILNYANTNNNSLYQVNRTISTKSGIIDAIPREFILKCAPSIKGPIRPNVKPEK